MRKKEVKDVNGKEREINITSISRKNLKTLKKYGYSVKVYKAPIEETVDEFEEGLDEVLKLVLNPDDIKFLDECSPGTIMNVWLSAIKETYGSVTEEKNSVRSGNGDQTEKESNIAPVVEKETKTKVK